MPPQFCPISFTLFPLIRGGEKKKHIPFWCTSEGTQTPHQVVLIKGICPHRGVCRWPPSLGPMAAGLCTPDKHLCHQPPSEQLQLTPFIIQLLYSRVFSILPFSFGASPIYSILCSFLSLLLLLVLPSPLVSLHFCSFFILSCNQITVTPCWC